jgi:hypothetical protein
MRRRRSFAPAAGVNVSFFIERSLGEEFTVNTTNMGAVS